ncbi:MAG: Cna B-type domain-containing protein [Lachnospiraceae bacterium]|nr:Cna B-type domain-containing protein [Lachnospiraceae bacterium]
MRAKRFFGILIALVLLLSFIPFGQTAFAEDEESSFDVNGSKTADPTELDSDHLETTVTLSLPSAEYQNEIDIVFVTDSSSSTELGSQFIESSTQLFESIIENNPAVTLKIGVVLFTGSANDAIAYVSDGDYKELTVYNEDTKDLFNEAFTISETLTKKEFRDAFGRGSGPHSGLDMANMWLEADKDVDNDHKYVVLFTDGKGYIWADANHKATTIYAQYYTSNKYTLASSGKPALSQVMGYNKMSYSVDVLDKNGKSNIYWFPTYLDLFNSKDPELTGVTKWDQPCLYAYGETWEVGMPDGEIVKHEVTNGAELFGAGSSTYGLHADYQYWYEFIPNETWTGITYQEANPFEVTVDENGKYTFDTENVNPDYYQYHVDCLQKGLYKAGHLWDEMVKKYKGAVITYDSSTGGGLELVEPFKEWLRANSLFSANKSDATQVEELFKDIDNSIRYMVSKGVVTDQITDSFTLKNSDNADGFRMTLGGEALNVTFADGKWNFGEADAEGVYPYVVEYDLETKTITWTLNVPVENTNPVTLSYDLIIDEESESGFYDTNVSAVLDYVSTDGKRDGTYTFEIPKVSYVRLIDIDVEKQWDDADDQDGKRPESITVNLMDGETVVQSAKITSESDWTYTFTKVPECKIEDSEMQFIAYTVEEEDVDGYVPETSGTKEDGFVIKNTHEPELIEITIEKVWDDNDDEKALRPDSIDVTLLANGEEIEAVSITEADDWKCTLTELPKYEAGEEISYTVEEAAVDGYTTSIEGFVIVNSLTESKEYTITYKLNGGTFGGKTADIIEVYPGGTVISIHEAPTREGYKFIRWEGSSYQPGDKYTVTEDHTFVAQWEPTKEVPDTGDNNSTLLWALLAFAAVFGMTGTIISFRRRRSTK